MHTLSSYADALKEDCGIRFVDMRIIDIVGDIMSSNFFAEKFKAAYKRFITGGRMMIRQQSVLPLLGKLGKNAPLEKTLKIIHIDGSTLDMSSKNNIVFVNQITIQFVKNDQKPDYFYKILS